MAPEIDKPPLWLAALYKPNAHKIAVRNLCRQGYEVFLPTIIQTQRQKQRFVQKVAPLFPGYIFINIGSLQNDWGPINHTMGINQLVRIGTRPATVPTRLIDAIRIRCNEDDIVVTARDLQSGQRIKMGSGPFADFVGTVESADSDQRVMMLIHLLGRDVRIKIPAKELNSATTL